MRNTYGKWGKLVCVYTYVHIFVKNKQTNKQEKKQTDKRTGENLFFFFVL